MLLGLLIGLLVCFQPRAQPVDFTLSQYRDPAEKLQVYARIIDSLRYDNRPTCLQFAKHAFTFSQEQNNLILQGKGFELLGYAHLLNFQYDSALHFLKQGLKLLREHPHKTVQLNLYTGDAFWYNGMFDSSLVYYERGQRYALESDNKPMLATITVNIADYYRQRGLYDKSLEVYQQGVKYAQQDTSGLYLPKAYNNMALLFSYMGDTYSELDYYFKAVEAAQAKPKLARFVGLYYSNISEVYATLGDHQKSLEYIKLGIEKSEEANQQRTLMNAYEMLSSIYLRMDSLQAARRAVEKSIHLNEEVKDKRYVARNLIHLGMLERLSGNHKSAIEHHLEALRIQNEIGDKKHKIKNLLQLTTALLEVGDISQAEKRNKEARLLSVELNIPPSIAQSYLLTSRLFEKRGDTKRALRYRQRYDSITERIEKQDRIRYINNLERLQVAKLKEMENLTLKKDMEMQAAVIDRQQKQFIAVVVVIMILLVIAFTIYWLLRKNQRSKKIISEQNDVLLKKNKEIQAMNDQQENLLHLVVHDLRSPLNKIEGLATIMKLEGPMLDNQKRLLYMMEEVTRKGKSYISEFLDNSQVQYRSRQPLKERFDLHELIEEVNKEWIPQAENKGIQLRCEKKLPIQPAWSDRGLLYHILINLISNAVKYSPNNTTIELRVWHHATTLHIQVKDEGQGFSESDKKKVFQRFQRLSAQPIGSETSTGLGLFLTKVLVDSLNGKISLVSEVGKGSTFTLIFEEVFA